MHDCDGNHQRNAHYHYQYQPTELTRTPPLRARATLCLGIVALFLAYAGGCGKPHGVTEYNLPGTVVVRQQFGGFHLVVNYYGSAPRLVEEKCIEGNGLTIRVATYNLEDLWVLDVSEAEEPVRVDFSAADERALRLTYLTWDPREALREFVDFAEERIWLEPNGVVHSHRTLLLDAELGGAHEISKLAELSVNAIRQAATSGNNEDSAAQLRTYLAHLRNLAVRHAAEVKCTLTTIRQQTKVEGGDAMAISDCESAIRMIESCDGSSRVR